MKYINVFIFVFIANWSFAQLTLEQNTPRSCPSTVQWHEERMSKDLEYKNHIERILADRVQYMNTTTGINQNGSCANVIVIPVAVHYDVGLVPAGSEACVEDIVNQQLVSLNADFASTNADVSNWSSYASCFDTSPGETCIEFCLATQNHPTGWGLNEGDPAITFGDTRFNWPNDIFAGDPLPANSDWAGYMNIFIQSGTGVLGISDGIPGNFSGTGVVVEACNFGGSETGPPVTCTGVNSGDSCGGIYDEGRTLTHEIGHYLGLFHIWGDNAICNGGQDGVADTPNMTTSHLGSTTTCVTGSGCGSLPNTCTNDPTPAGGTEDYPDMPFNYMSYVSDNCMWMFTEGQASVMLATVQAAGFTTTTDKCGDTSISATDEVVCLPDTEAVFDISIGLPSDYMETLVLTVSGNPAGTSTTFSQNNITASTNLTLTVSGITAANIGTFTLTITGDDGAGTVLTTMPDLTVSDAPPGVVALVNPADGAIDVDSPVAFEWTTVANATGYQMQIATDAGFTNVVFDTGTIAGNTAGVTGFATSTTYYWRARAIGDCGDSAWTDGSFTTASAFSCTSFEGGPYIDFSPAPCFPDCTTPTTVAFEIYGNEAYILEELTAGVEYEFEFCTGYNSALYATNLTVAGYDGAGGVVPGTTVFSGSGCSAIFTPPSDGDYIVIIYTNCGDPEIPVDNGAPTFACTGNIVLPQEVAQTNGSYSATYEYEEGGWTHYIDGGAACNTLTDDILLLSVQKGGENIGSVGTGAFDVSVVANSTASQILENGNYISSIGGDWYSMNRFWTLTPETEPTNPVGVRFYYTDADFNAVNTLMGNTLTGQEDMDFWKINDIAITYNSDPTAGHVGVPEATVFDGDGFWRYSSGGASTSTYAYSPFGPYHQVEFTVGHFGGGGGGALTPIILPVELISFTGEASAAGNLLAWVTASEINNDYFELERSSSSSDEFVAIAQIDGAGNASSEIRYQWLDESPSLGRNYYRLKQVDFDGSETYSEVIAVDYSLTGRALIYPNPVRDVVRLSFDSAVRGQAEIELYGFTGQLLRSWQVQVNPGRENIPLQLTNIPAGAYFVRIQTGEQVIIEKLIKE